MTENQQHVIATLSDRGAYSIARNVEECWKKNQMAYLDARYGSLTKGIMKAFDQGNEEALQQKH